jgi:dTDP-4-dehydrorhamnose 3,5-epimerase
MDESYDFQESSLKGVWVQHPKTYADNRGLTSEILNLRKAASYFDGLAITQILEASSSRGVIRGIHYSSPDNPQVKLVRCIQGQIKDVVVDLRPNSTTFGNYEVFELNSEITSNLMISSGFGHAYQVLSDRATVIYALQTEFNFSEEFSINPLDADLALPWMGISPILSARDATAPGYKETLRGLSSL